VSQPFGLNASQEVHPHRKSKTVLRAYCPLNGYL
jgi:hypothetical protein